MCQSDAIFCRILSAVTCDVVLRKSGNGKIIGIGTQSTLGEDTFARKYMYENFTECLNFA